MNYILPIDSFFPGTLVMHHGKEELLLYVEGRNEKTNPPYLSYLMLSNSTKQSIHHQSIISQQIY